MRAKRHWRYKKGIFGRRRREYFLENVFGVDTFNMKTFRALKTKLSRDYLGFFGNLNKMYQRGEFKNIAKESVSIVKQTVSLLEGMIESGTIDKRDVDVIVENVNELNSRRDVLVQKSEEVQALKDRLSGIEETTGISPESLNITERIVRGGARREVRKRREGVLPFLKRTMPRTRGLAGELVGGLGTAAFGPFAPMAKMIGGLGRDIFGLGRGIFQKMGERKERKLGRSLFSLSRGLSEEELGRVGGFRGTGRMLDRSTRIQARKESSKILMDFFNRDAYRAKWTKELLKKLSGIGEKGEGGLLDILKTVGKVGLAGGAVAAVSKLKDLPKVVKELGEAKKERAESAIQASKARKQQMDVIKKIGPEEFVKKTGRPSIRGLAMERAGQERKGFEDVWASRPWMLKLPGISRLARKKAEREVNLKPFYERTAEIEEGLKKIQREINLGDRRESPGIKTQAELLEAINKLDAAILGLSKNISIERSPTSIREPGLGNPWDGSDPLSSAIAGSELELED